MATINATVGELVTFYLDGAPEDVEDWQVRIYDTEGDVVEGPDADDFDTLTEGVEVEEVGPSEVQYSVTLTAPTTAGTYTVAWMTSGQESEPDTLIVVAVTMLVTLAMVKDYLNISPSDDNHDAKLTRAILTARPLVEAITGPIVPRTITESHAGGTSAIQVRRRPSTAPGTSPVLTLVSVTEYIGSTPHELDTVASPDLGETYSVTIDEIGTITRRTSGGGVGVFAGDRVDVVYIAGQSETPANVVDGTLELIAVNYVKTQPYGRGRMVVEDENREASGPHMGWYIPGRVRQMLSPNRRGPSIA
jgi:hypothetical protein